MRSLVAGIALMLTAGVALAEDAPLRLQAPALVETIVHDDFARIRPSDRLRVAIRGRYFDGFALALERSCNFLPPEGLAALRTRLGEATTNRDGGVVMSAASAGLADGRTFTERFGCGHVKLERAQRHLAGFLARTNGERAE